jgi:drug/metabolite transporter (DMT)-like permease
MNDPSGSARFSIAGSAGTVRAGRRLVERWWGTSGRAVVAPPEARRPRIARAIGFIVVATVLFVTMNTSVKYLSQSLPTVQLIWARTLVHLVLVVALFAPRFGGWRLLATSNPATQLARSLLLVLSTALFFTALGHVPLADATSVSFTAPLMVAGLAGPLLGERFGLGHWASIALGFVGALIVIRPTGGGANVYAFLVLGSAACYALYQLFTRRVSTTDRPETSVTYSALVGTVLLSVIVPFFWRTPDRMLQWVLLGTLGLFGGLGHYCVARALLWGPASIVSPFHYVQLIWAAAMGYVIFGDVPGAWTWIGAATIVGSGLSIAWRETRPT